MALLNLPGRFTSACGLRVEPTRCRQGSLLCVNRPDTVPSIYHGGPLLSDKFAAEHDRKSLTKPSQDHSRPRPGIEPTAKPGHHSICRRSNDSAKRSRPIDRVTYLRPGRAWYGIYETIVGCRISLRCWKDCTAAKHGPSAVSFVQDQILESPVYWADVALAS
ncbi:hypothetical protein Bbelb_132590 [Branchiostoma belcheri]|nr:hypothetical protein Bbelb_132590 [Branchiostoma belcheri]